MIDNIVDRVSAAVITFTSDSFASVEPCLLKMACTGQQDKEAHSDLQRGLEKKMTT